MAKKLYERWILHVNRQKGQNAIFEKLEREYKLIYSPIEDTPPGEKQPDPKREIYEPVMLTEKEALEFNLLSAQTGIGYFEPEEIKPEEGVTSETYNEEGFDNEGFNRAGEYNAIYDKTP
jgi:hypothetical protein